MITSHFDFGADELQGADNAIAADELEGARRGIPQGASTSSIVLELILAPVLASLPNCGLVLNYADNFMVLAKTEDELLSLSTNLGSALKAHPAGPLKSKTVGIFGPGEAIQFLGHLVKPDGQILPSPESLAKFKATFNRHQRRLSQSVPPRIRRIWRDETRGYVHGWCAAFKLWDGVKQQHRNHYLALLRLPVDRAVPKIWRDGTAE